MTPNKLGAVIAGSAAVVAAVMVGGAAIISGHGNTLVGPEVAEHHRVTLSAQGLAIETFTGTDSHPVSERQYSTTIDVTGPADRSGLAVSAKGTGASCAIDVDGVRQVQRQVSTGDSLLLAYCGLEAP